MEKITYKELREIFCKHERKVTDGSHVSGCIVFTEDSFTQPYSLEARTYAVSSNNKAYRPNMGGYSIYGSALDGTDPLVRLEGYMADEKGGKDGWKVDYCYLTTPTSNKSDVRTCGECKHCYPEASCDCDCKCTAKSDEVTFEVSQDDDIRFYGEKDNEPCEQFSAR